MRMPKCGRDTCANNHFVVIKEHKACQHQQKFPQVTNWNITVSPDPWSFVPRSLVTPNWRQTRREREAVTHVPVFNLYEVTQQAVRSTAFHKALLSWPKHLWCRFTKLLCIAKAKEDKEKEKQGWEIYECTAAVSYMYMYVHVHQPIKEPCNDFDQ